MSHVSEERLALYAGSDLSRDEARGVEQHLRSCAECRASLAEYQHDRAVLLSSLTEPAANELGDVRRCLLLQLEEQSRATGNWMWAAAVAVAAIVVAMFLFPWQQSRRAVHPDPAITSYLCAPYRQIARPTIPNLATVVASRRVSRNELTPGLRTVSLLSERDRPPILKMTTSDPEVVILWQLNGRTQRQ
jgi:anti-sigma factor RsiW